MISKNIHLLGIFISFDNELFGEIIKYSDIFIERIANKDYRLNVQNLNKFTDKFISSCDGLAMESVTYSLK